MRKLIARVLILTLIILIGSGCAKKKEEVEIIEPEILTLPVPSPEIPKITILPPDEISPLSLTREEEKLLRNKKIQEALRLAGFYEGEIDGKIGPKTRKAIRDFQAAKGLKVDGIVGPITWKELEKILASQKPTPKKSH